MGMPKDSIKREIWRIKQSESHKGHISVLKGKTFEAMYGLEKAKQMKERLSIANSGINNPFYGTHRSEETKRKIRLARKGKIVSEETRHKISLANTGKSRSKEWKEYMSKLFTGVNNPMYGKIGTNLGKKFSKEHKMKISLANKGKIRSKEIRNQISLRQMGKTYEERFGMKRALEIKQKKNNKLKGRKILWIDKIIKANKGKHHSLESINKIKLARTKQIVPIKDTKIEIKIQMFLKELSYEFFTHQYIKDIKHGYQCDILVPALNLVIECDGNFWHKYPIGTDLDHVRTKELLEKGFKVLRLWECEIKIMDINKFNEKLKLMKECEVRCLRIL